MKTPLAFAALASFVTALCQAATPPAVPENLQACSKLQDAGERVRCYDTQIAAMNAAAAASAQRGANTGVPAISRSATMSSTTSDASTAAPTASRSIPAEVAQQPFPDARFGAETLPSTSHPKAVSPEQVVLLSSIMAMRAIGHDTYVISLSNGQVWRQAGASQLALFFRIGDDVRIEKGALGSYHMSTAGTGSKNWVRVTRVQ